MMLLPSDQLAQSFDFLTVLDAGDTYFVGIGSLEGCTKKVWRRTFQWLAHAGATYRLPESHHLP